MGALPEQYGGEAVVTSDWVFAAAVAVFLKSPNAYLAAFVGGVGRDLADLLAASEQTCRVATPKGA